MFVQLGTKGRVKKRGGTVTGDFPQRKKEKKNMGI